MKKIRMAVLLSLLGSGLPSAKAHSQLAVLEVIKEGITKVIVAVDLKIQRLQNETIWLQNAQKTVENELSRLQLEEISSWVEKQRRLYADYFEELWRVKAALTYYHRVKTIMEQQLQIMSEYKSTWALFRQDKYFTPEERDHMARVYSGMLEESGRTLDQLLLVVRASLTQMSDAGRLEIIDAASQNMEQTLMDLRAFNHQSKLISLQRAAAKGEIGYTKKLYGLP